MTNLLVDLRTQLEMTRGLRVGLPPSGQWTQLKYSCIEDLILREGRVYHSRAPPCLPTPRACFQKSYHRATRKASKWIYVEGYAVSASVGLAVQHAWITRADDPDGAYDCAWAEGPAAYLGVAFQTDYVRRVHRASKRLFYSVLDAWWLHHPLLTGKHALAKARWEPAAPSPPW